MKFHTQADLNGYKILQLGAGTNSTDAVNKGQLDAQASGRLLGYFQIANTENQTVISIPSNYQSKGTYICYSESQFIPPQYITVAATTLTFNTSSNGIFLIAGTITVLVYS